MECPACGRELKEMKAGEIVVDVCENGCGGIWFDNYELQKVDEKHEAAGEVLLNIARDPNVKTEQGKQRSCPKCPSQLMIQRFASVKHEVEVDECVACGGIWLDYGELGKIRDQYQDEAERKEAARTYFHEAFGAEFDKLQQENERELGTAHKVARVFRFICPSYYIPGQQSWGAF